LGDLTRASQFEPWRDPALLRQFDEYLVAEENAEIVKLQSVCGSLELVKKLALLSCHDRGKMQDKKKRRRIVSDMLRCMIKGYEFGEEVFRTYGRPDLAQRNRELLQMSREVRENQAQAFDTRRFGKEWNAAYLCQLKYCVAKAMPTWSAAKILSAVTCLVSAARRAMKAPGYYESKLRDRIREAIKNYEENPKNQETLRKQRALLFESQPSLIISKQE
jgi:hypothetical protein